MLHTFQTWWESLEPIKQVGWAMVIIPLALMFCPLCAVASMSTIGTVILCPLVFITPIAIGFLFFFGRNSEGLALAARITLVVYILSMAIIVCSKSVNAIIGAF